ncbi:MAG: ATP-binding protein, partial [Thermoplasmata archaeon]|nr:ATP-binding protein [Thermoplasmata archaeon]
AKKIVRAYMVIRLLKPRLILWDDFDAALHPSLVKGLLKWLYSGNWQVVLSTHSLDVLYYLLDILEDGKNEKKEGNIQVLLLRRVDDILYHKSLSVEELEDLIDSNTDPRFLATTIKV